MDAWVWVLLAVAVVAVLVIAVFAWLKARRRRLRQTFGPEYDRALAEAPTRREAEAGLEGRRKRRDELDIRPLPTEAAERYGHEWQGVQARFVDAPVEATRDADRLVQQVMSDRGYPMNEFDSRADLISVDHPTVVENYREAHTTYLNYDRGEASTEDLRQAMVHYRSLFDELVESGVQAQKEVR